MQPLTVEAVQFNDAMQNINLFFSPTLIKNSNQDRSDKYPTPALTHDTGNFLEEMDVSEEIKLSNEWLLLQHFQEVEVEIGDLCTQIPETGLKTLLNIFGKEEVLFLMEIVLTFSGWRLTVGHLLVSPRRK
jgi:hypothetical protein